MNTNNDLIQIALAIQSLVKKGYVFKMVNNTIEVTSKNGSCDYYTNNEFKKWIILDSDK